MTRIAFAAVALVAVYLLVLASDDPLDAALGALLAAVLLWSLRRFLFPGGVLAAPGFLGRVVRFPLFALIVVREITVGTWNVAVVVLGVRRLEAPGIIAIPIGERTPVGVVVSAIAATLSPGEFLVDIDWEKGVYYMHVLDAADPDAVRAHHEHLYQRFQKAVFP